MRKPVIVWALVLAAAAAGCGGAQEGGEGSEGGGLLSAVRPKPAPIVIPAGTNLDVRLTTGLSSEEASDGDPFEGVLEHPLVVGEKVAIPKGAEVRGKVTKAVKSGRLKQRAELWVTVTDVVFRGKPWPVTTTTTGHKEGSKTTRNILFIGGGGGAGAAIGGIAGGGKGAGIGAAIGAGSGLAGAMLTGKRDIKFPAETLLRFELEQELKIQP